MRRKRKASKGVATAVEATKKQKKSSKKIEEAPKATGRQRGATNWSSKEKLVLIELVEKHSAIGSKYWEKVARDLATKFGKSSEEARDIKSCKKQFDKLRKKELPLRSGDRGDPPTDSSDDDFEEDSEPELVRKAKQVYDKLYKSKGRIEDAQLSGSDDDGSGDEEEDEVSGSDDGSGDEEEDDDEVVAEEDNNQRSSSGLSNNPPPVTPVRRSPRKNNQSTESSAPPPQSSPVATASASTVPSDEQKTEKKEKTTLVESVSAIKEAQKGKDKQKEKEKKKKKIIYVTQEEAKDKRKSVSHLINDSNSLITSTIKDQQLKEDRWERDRRDEIEYRRQEREEERKREERKREDDIKREEKKDEREEKRDEKREEREEKREERREERERKARLDQQQMMMTMFGMLFAMQQGKPINIPSSQSPSKEN